MAEAPRTTPFFRYGLVLLFGAVAFVAGLAASLGVGAVSLSPLEVWEALRGGGEATARTIVLELRGPRTLGAALVGGALAVVGAVLQAVMRNPLADPYVLGVSSGASVGAALAAVFGASSLWSASTLGFGTALISVLLVYRIAQVGQRVPPLRLLLAGIAVSSFATALTSLLLYFAPEATAVRGVLFWLLGGLSGASWATLFPTAAVVVPAVAALFFLAHTQTLLLLGDEVAGNLGVDVRQARGALVAISALVAGGVVAFAGAIGFVGLIVPHALRPNTGPEHGRLLPASFLYGAALLLWMDTAARRLLAPEELPVGILCGLLGAPFFLMLLAQRGAVDE